MMADIEWNLLSAGRVNVRSLWVAVYCNVLNYGKWCCLSLKLEIGSRGLNYCMFLGNGNKKPFRCIANSYWRALLAGIDLYVMFGSGYSG